MKILAPNTLLQNRYLVVHLIGKGGMGEVYLAVDQRLGSAVALKRTFFSDDETLGNAFEREARILGRLRHPVLPKVSDHFIENDNQYLVMEHISGDDLAKRLEITQKPFPLSWVLFWADQLLDAVSYLHSHEPPIIHRDIKPQNLKLTDENNIILLDFGLSKSSIGDSRLSNPVSSNASGSVVGYTPHYAPMEQIRGTGTNPRSDIYALSATIYQLLTNVVPQDALSRADALLNGSPDPIQPISEINAEVSKAVSDVIIKGMAVSQDLRYATAREMQKELRDAYSQLQKAMSAQTVAFTAPEAVIPIPAEQTEPLISVPPVETASVNTVTEEIQANPSALKTEVLPVATQEEAMDFDATLRYDGEPQTFPSKQSDIKTEVFSGGIEFVPAELQNEAASSESKPEPAENYSPEATTPLITFEEEKNIPAEVDFSLTEEHSNLAPKEENAEEAMPATEMFMPTEDYPAAENIAQQGNFEKTDDYSFTPAATQFSGEQYNQEQNDSQPQQAAVAAAATQQQKKSGGGKVFAILGILGLLMILGIGAAGFGYWYFYGGGSTTTETDPTPTPATVSPTPTPQEILVDNNSNTNTEGSNSSTDLTNTNTNSETNSTTNSETTKTDGTNTKTDVTKINPTPAVQTKTPVPQITRIPSTPKQATTTPIPKVTPAKTPVKKDDPTKIQG